MPTMTKTTETNLGIGTKSPIRIVVAKASIRRRSMSTRLAHDGA